MPLTAQDYENLFARVLLVRLAEEQIMKEYFQDEMKTPVHLGIGGEAIAAGVHFACPKDTEYFGTYRNHALFLNCSRDTEAFFGEMYGKISGCAKGKAGSMHLSCPEHGLIATSAVVATTIPVAAGAALSARYLRTDKIVVVMFGDGAVEEGVFFETLNFASLKNLPLLFVCEDNELAIHSHSMDRKGYVSLAQIAQAFALEYVAGDGSDASEVVLKTREVVSRMRASGKPGFLHFSYYRFLEHVGPLEDFNKGYRKKPSDIQERWDPLPKIRAAALSAGVPADSLKRIETETLRGLEASVAKAKAAAFPPAPELFADVYSSREGNF